MKILAPNVLDLYLNIVRKTKWLWRIVNYHAEYAVSSKVSYDALHDSTSTNSSIEFFYPSLFQMFLQVLQQLPRDTLQLQGQLRSTLQLQAQQQGILQQLQQQ